MTNLVKMRTSPYATMPLEACEDRAENGPLKQGPTQPAAQTFLLVFLEPQDVIVPARLRVVDHLVRELVETPRRAVPL